MSTLIVSVIAMSLSSCRSPSPGPLLAPGWSPPRGGRSFVVATVNGVAITEAMVEWSARGAPFDLIAAGCDEMRGVVLDDMIDEELLLQEARRKGVVRGAPSLPAPGVELDAQSWATLRRERRTLATRIAAPSNASKTPSRSAVAAAYRVRSLEDEGQFEVVFFEVDLDDATSEGRKLEDARKLVATMTAEPTAPFCELGRRAGGASSLGANDIQSATGSCVWDSSSQSLLQEVRALWPQSALALKAGAVSAPLQHTRGFVVVRVVDPGPSFEALRERLEKEIVILQSNVDWVERLAWLRGEATIDIADPYRGYVDRVRHRGLNGQLCVRPQKTKLQRPN